MAESIVLSPAARAILSEILIKGQAPTKSRKAAVDELITRGLVTRTRGVAKFTPAGQFAAKGMRDV